MTLMKIPLDKKKILSRCVKCNHPKLKLITKEEAMKTLQWENAEEKEDTQFYICESCKQIYWEGGMFKRAKANFESIASWGIKGIDENKEKAKEEIQENVEEIQENVEEVENDEGLCYKGIEGLSEEVYLKVKEIVKEELEEKLRKEILEEAIENLKKMM